MSYLGSPALINYSSITTVFGNAVIPKTSGVGLKVDTSLPTFGWRDITATTQPKATGVGSPARTQYAGANLHQYAFVLNDVCEFEYHLPHDYVLGSDLYFHVHWSHTGTIISGSAVFTAYVTYAKGHNQAAFPAEKTITITQSTPNVATVPRYQHLINEVAITGATDTATTFANSVIEVDGLVLVTLKLTTIPSITSGSLFVHTCDLHYQSTNIATKQKAPNFYV